MSVRNLGALFRPRSIAVVGASNRVGSVGTVVFRNALRGGFTGRVMPVNPKYDTVQSVVAYPSVAALPAPVDLGVICTPPDTVPGIIRELVDAGARAAIVLTAGLSDGSEADGQDLQSAMLEAAQPGGLRILGPNCLGVMVPGIGLDCSFAHLRASPGELAFLSQSGALCTAVLDWSAAAGIGFSHFVSLGNSADVDVGDLLDYLGADAGTSAILMYVESVKHPRKFMSAARAAARNKPVLVVKAGREPMGAVAATSHTGALAGSDAVFDAAISRTGMLRVFEISELFDSVETFATPELPDGGSLAILTNGGGPGVMAVDALSAQDGRLAELSSETVDLLGTVLPGTWSGTNPVDMIGDSPATRYAKALPILRRDPGVDAVLVLHTPTALVTGLEAARAVIEAVEAPGGATPVFTSLLGRETADEGRRLLREAHIPTYETPEQAVSAFLRLVRYRRNQELLAETPPSLLEDFEPATRVAARVVAAALDEGRSLLNEPESKDVLSAYGIPVVETKIARDAQEAVERARDLGFPVALKILSPQVTHKSDVGGVALDLEDARAVAEAATAMAERLRSIQPGAEMAGFTVQRMARRPGAHELIVGVATDPVFGPVILFGEGGTAVELIQDRAVALPPLNAKLAADLVSRTRISKLLRGYRGRPPAHESAVLESLIKVSQLVIDLPEVVELDVNPLLADEHGVLALDARIRISTADTSRQNRLAIRPYPKELEEAVELSGGRTVFVRPIRPEDEPAHADLFRSFTPEDIRFRFFGLVREMPHSQLARYTQIDYDREMAFIAVGPNGSDDDATLGVVRAVADSDNTRAEFAIIVRSALAGQGLGHALLEKMIRYCRDRGTTELVGEVMTSNQRMLALASKLGFERRFEDGDSVRVSLLL